MHKEDDLMKHTTLNFEGMVCICTGYRKDSWVCRWQGITRQHLVSGAYAVSIVNRDDDDESDDGPLIKDEEASFNEDDYRSHADEGSVADSIAPSAAVTNFVETELLGVKDEPGLNDVDSTLPNS